MKKVYIAKYEEMEDSEILGVFSSPDGAQKGCQKRIAHHVKDHDKRSLHMKEKYETDLPNQQWVEVPGPVYLWNCQNWHSSTGRWLDTGQRILVEIWDLHP